MSLISMEFLIFVGIAVIGYYLIPKRFQWIWLLIFSYIYYASSGIKILFFLLYTTITTYGTGRLLDRVNHKELPRNEAKSRKRRILIGCLLLNFGMLAVLKYTNFAIENVNAIFHAGISFQKLILPLGISFYTFQSMGYIIDVYWGKYEAEKNPFRFALFVSFFPQLVAGPIERSSRLLNQFNDRHKFDYDRVCRGLMMMVWGFFQKMVIADRVAVFVNQIFNYYNYYSGLEIFIGMLFFAVQIYCDFAGYSNIALGAAQVMGFDLMQNFTQPYLARSVAEFWKRWHISLTSWFRDYLYIPLGGNRKGKWIKYRNIMIIFLTSGLWHGANWTYVIWGGLNGAFQIVGAQTLNLRKRIKKAAGIREDSWSYKMLATVITFLLVDFTWIFFRADNIEAAFSLIRQMFSGFRPWILIDGSLYAMGLSFIDFWIGMIAIAVLLAVDILHSRNVHIREWIVKQNLWFRWGIYLLAVYSILIFGYYGPNFDATQFIYFQF